MEGLQYIGHKIRAVSRSFLRIRQAGKIRNVSKRASGSASGVVVRRRDDVLMSAIRTAVRDELTDRGYSGVTFESVARRAKTSKPVLYRRYRSRAEMVIDALAMLQWQPGQPKSTSSLREDLLTQLTSWVEGVHRIGVDTYRNILAEADDELFDALPVHLAPLVDQTIFRALSDARDRGEIGPREIPDRVATTVLALLRNELFFTRNRVDRETVAAILDTVYLPLIDAVSHRSDPYPRPKTLRRR